MADHSKKILRDEAEREQLKRGDKKAEMPRCHRGAVAVIHVSNGIKMSTIAPSTRRRRSFNR